MNESMTTTARGLSERDRRLLVGLADGVWTGRRRHRAEKRIARVADGAALLERQQRVAHLLRGGPEVPGPLAERPAAPERLEVPRMRPWTGVALAALVVAAGVLTATLVAVLARPTIPAPRVLDAAAAGFEPATEAAPRSRPGHRALVTASFEGVDFPNWSRRFGWHTTGARTDSIEGRTTHTVFYGHMGHRLGYTVVSGSPLKTPASGRHLTRNGVAITLIGDHHHATAVFVRNGRTCILSAHVAHLATLVKLASWKGDGGVRF
jgi:hypothetical protein